MTAARAMTLIEVLAATVLLSVMVAACVPWLRMGDLPPQNEEQISQRELSVLADLMLADPDLFGLMITDSLGQTQPIASSMIDEVSSASVSMRVYWSDQPEVDHGWAVFSAGDVQVFRWIKKPDTQESEA